MEKVDQILNNGQRVFDYDEILRPKQIKDLFKSLFKENFKEDEKQFILFDKVGVLCANITYLGNPHPKYKKRMQLKPYFLDFVKKNASNGIVSLYVGIYTYKKTQLFVTFNPKTFVEKKSHNSSAHIFSTNLQYAQRVGEFSKIDYFGNEINVFKREHFIKYIKTLAGIEEDDTSYEGVMKLINEHLRPFFESIKTDWNGIECYKEMKDMNYSNYRQGEWAGFYFEYLFENYCNFNNIDDIKKFANKSKGGIDLDLIFPNLKNTYGDLKADSINKGILGNKLQTVKKVVSSGGIVYYICALYETDKDKNHNYETTKFWNELRDERKKYKNIDDLEKGYGTKMNYSINIKSFHILKIDNEIFDILKDNPFKQGKNSNGKARGEKIKINKDLISSISIYEMKC